MGMIRLKYSIKKRILFLFLDELKTHFFIFVLIGSIGYFFLNNLTTCKKRYLKSSCEIFIKTREENKLIE